MARSASRVGEFGERKFLYRLPARTTTLCPDYQWSSCRYQNVLRLSEG